MNTIEVAGVTYAIVDDKGSGTCQTCDYHARRQAECFRANICPKMGVELREVVAGARVTDPVTSKDAAKVSKRASIKDHILLELAIHGGCTGKEIANRCAIPLNSITPRFKELVDSGQIEDSGERRDRQIVWRIKP